MHVLCMQDMRSLEALSPSSWNALYSPSQRAIVSILHPCWGRPFLVRVSLTLQRWVRLWFELTHDAMTRKIQAGSDLRHDVRYIYIKKYMENSQQTCLCGARSSSPQWSPLFTSSLSTPSANSQQTGTLQPQVSHFMNSGQIQGLKMENMYYLEEWFISSARV